MDYSQLQFAASVRQLALTFATKALDLYKDEIREDEENRDALLEKWIADNPVSTFVPEAFDEIKSVAMQIAAMNP